MAEKRVEEYAKILWTLKLDGDVNENHEGGSASRTLRERLEARGFTISSVGLSNRLQRLRANGIVYSLASENGRTTKVIRLVERDVESLGYPNPFEDEADVEPTTEVEVMPHRHEGSLMNGHRNWSIQDRLQLIAELSESVREDMAKLKAVL